MRTPEQIDWSQCPLVETKPRVLGGAPVLRGTRMPVSAIVDNSAYGLSAAEIVEQVSDSRRASAGNSDLCQEPSRCAFYSIRTFLLRPALSGGAAGADRSRVELAAIGKWRTPEGGRRSRVRRAGHM
jgi:uncharacterized protein (DUF433 family)